MRFLAGVLLAASAACAQTIINPAAIPAAIRSSIDDRDAKQSLKCSVTPIKPRLNFGFRFQAGYVVRVPMNQYFGSGHQWRIITRVTPDAESGDPVYLATRVNLPTVEKTNAHAELGGAFLLGEGRYRAEWTLVDEAGRTCRKDWDIKAALSRGERAVKVALAPGTIRDLSLRRSYQPAAEAGGSNPVRLTMLLHAAPLSPRRMRLHPSDTFTLLGSVSSLIDSVRPGSVRLVVFNLDQRTEIFRQDDFTLRAMGRVARAVNSTELGLVDYRILQNRRGHLEFLVELIKQELEASEPSDAIVFLGPTSRFSEKPSAELVETSPDVPYFLYFQFKPYFRRTASFPDSIQHAVSRLKGKTMLVHTPGEFAEAIRQLESRVLISK